MRRVLIGLLLLVVAALAVPASALVPYVVDDQRLDRVVVAVALDWRDFGLDKAQERLRYELDAQGIGGHVSDESCALLPEPDGVRRVRCAWTVAVDLPWAEQTWSLSFESSAAIGAEGDLLR